MQTLTFTESVNVSLCSGPVRDVDAANFLLHSRWPLNHILGSDGLEPVLLKKARNACARATITRTAEAVALARQSFVDAARVAGVLVPAVLPLTETFGPNVWRRKHPRND